MSAKNHVFTLGIEEEFAIVDPESRELRSHIHEILEDGRVTLKEQIKPEMHQSVVELGTEILRRHGRCKKQRTRAPQPPGRIGSGQPTQDRVGRPESFFTWAQPTHTSSDGLSGTC